MIDWRGHQDKRDEEGNEHVPAILVNYGLIGAQVIVARLGVLDSVERKGTNNLKTSSQLS